MAMQLYKTDKNNNNVEAGRISSLTIASGATGSVSLLSYYTVYVTGLWIGPIKHCDITLYSMINSDLSSPLWVPIQVENLAGNESVGFRLKNDIFHMQHPKGIKIEIKNNEAQDVVYYYSIAVKETQFD